MSDQQMYPVDPAVVRYQLNKKMPYFADVIYRLVPKPQDDLPTFGVDEHFRWFYGREVPFTPEEQVTVLFHEINHLIRNHFGREGDRDARQWNVAGDREINDWFPQGMDIPATGVGSKKYGMDDCGLPDNELAEWYFDRLDQFELHAREDADTMTAGSGPCKTHPNCDSKDKPVKMDSKYNVKQKGVMHVPVCGGAAGNGSDDPTQGEAPEGAVSDIEAQAVRQGVAEKVKEAAEKGRGNLPGSLVDWADKFLNPVVPWQKILRLSSRKASTIIAGDTTQTFTKPARRSPPGIILPKKVSRRTVCAFYADTSGSVSDQEIAQCLAEVKGALRTNLADLTVSFIDTQVYTTVKAGNGHFRMPTELRRGGTDMTKCFPHADKLRPRPNLVIVLTDGETPWPSVPPRGMRTIIVLTQKNDHYPIPEWVWKTIVMEKR